MNQFNLKSLTFYGVTIAFVLVLFKVVTAYGETSLQASPPIEGTYRLTASGKSPCVDKGARLAIEQSGIYLLGTLSTNGENIALDGRFQGDTFRLRGRSPSGKSCSEEIIVEAIAQDKTVSGTVQGVSVDFKKEAIDPGDSLSGNH